MDSIPADQILAPLNPQQRLAVETIEGPMLILAGPGSGKTRVITHRIANMLAQGIDARQIVALTFTNKAADEMKKRINQLVPGTRVWTSTFHRFCSQLVRQYSDLVGVRSNFTIYDAGDSKKIMKSAIAKVAVNLKHYTPDSLANQISNVKSKAITHQQFQPRIGHALDSIVAKVYPEYQNQLQIANAVDFDDLLLFAVELLRNSPELRDAFDARFKYMMVDEYQDTNLAQYQLIRLLNYRFTNLAVTGDPDQSIYGWRGANINNILNFESDFSGAKIVRLEQNYRSTPEILSVADQLIQNNARRKKKSMHTENESGDAVRLVTFSDPKDESADIADTIALAVSQGGRQPQDFAILYRTNFLSRTLEIALSSAGLPYQIVNGTEFYQRKEIKDLLGYLYLLNNPSDTIAFERIVNVPPRKIGKVTVNRLREYAETHRLSLLEAAQSVDQIESIKRSPNAKIKAFVEMMDRLAQHVHDPVHSILEAVLKETGYEEWLEFNDHKDDVDRVANVQELLVAAEEFDSEFFEEGNALESYLERSALVAATDDWDNDSNRVSLMTLHAAKGLEFPSVFIIGLEDGILPHERSSKDDEQLEEERRLLFVGITRAQQHLQISRCQNRFRKGSYWPSIPSRFLMELPRQELRIFEPGGTPYGSMDDDFGVDDDWGDDLPSIDINEVPDVQIYKSAEGRGGDSKSGDDQVREIRNEVEYKLSLIHRDSGDAKERPCELATDKFPRIMTASEMTAPVAASTSSDDFQTGMSVVHDQYGVGVIETITGKGTKRTATVEFESCGSKSFRLAYAKLRILSC